MPTKRPNLEFALLGLLAEEAASGYDLRKIFHDTPLGMYSDSPGSIYPALRRLEARRLITGPRGAPGRQRRTFRITARGRGVLVHWLNTPITPEQVARNTGEAELRLAFLSDHAPPGVLREFLRRYSELLDEHREAIATVRKVVAHKLSPSARLALDLGLTVADARAAWCRKAARNAKGA